LSLTFEPKKYVKLEGAQRVHISAKMGLGMEIGWEGDGLHEGDG